MLPGGSFGPPGWAPPQPGPSVHERPYDWLQGQRRGRQQPPAQRGGIGTAAFGGGLLRGLPTGMFQSPLWGENDLIGEDGNLRDWWEAMQNLAGTLESRRTGREGAAQGGGVRNPMTGQFGSPSPDGGTGGYSVQGHFRPQPWFHGDPQKPSFPGLGPSF